MTVVIDLPLVKKGYEMHQYSTWCYKNIFEPGEPKSWAILEEGSGNTKYLQRKIIFLHSEDAVVFKLRFGL